MRVATIPGGVSKLAMQDSFDATQGSFLPPTPNHLAEILAALEPSVRDAEGRLSGMTDDQAKANWRLMRKDQEIFSQPRSRSIYACWTFRFR